MTATHDSLLFTATLDIPMICLYQGSGASNFEVLGHPITPEDWAKLRIAACRLLRRRDFEHAAHLLEDIPFEVRDGTNDFGDDFSLLYLVAPLDKYVDLSEHETNKDSIQAFKVIAKTITEIGPFIRFVAIDLDVKASPTLVSNPNLAITSDVVEQALKDAEQLIATRGALSGVDRAHTAFHGYLKAVCSKSGISVSSDLGITGLFKAISGSHPNLQEKGPQAEDIGKVARGIASVLDALNPLRNRATLAHPNDSLLDEPEAMLVINSIRTLLHYLNSKLRS